MNININISISINIKQNTYIYEDVVDRFEEALSHEYDYVEVPMDAAA